jgi:phosphatidylserine decarboxylase
MEKIIVYDREKKQYIEEEVYFKSALEFLYKDNFFSKMILFFIAKFPFFSNFFAFFNSLKISKNKIRPFIEHFNINENEFYKSNFKSFKDFFIRKLREDAREIGYNEDILVFPCDGRFLVYPKIDDFNSYSIKNERFSLEGFLQDKNLADKFKSGSMLLARLAPQDYHRFHFPCDCIPKEARLINGYLYSVNPIALKRNIKILQENKRMITILETKKFSEVLCVEIGATNVGSIKQTFFPNTEYQKGEEKGYFSIGGSSIVLLFKEGIIKFDSDLIENSKKNIETKAKLGSSFATRLFKKKS